MRSLTDAGKVVSFLIFPNAALLPLPRVKPLLFDYTLNNKILLRRSSVQDLGVLFDSKLSFCDYILSITSAAFKSLGFVLRSAKEFGDVVTLKLLYITYVRSKLEYASLVWSPIHNIYIAQLERVQRRFLKSAIFMLDGLYPTGAFLRNFFWTSLVCSLCQADD
jgi:hypothetical protein